MQTVLAEYVRRTHVTLPQFIELLRGQSESDNRPTKAIIPNVAHGLCEGHGRFDDLIITASEGIHVTTSQSLPPQPSRPNTHPPAILRINVLRKNIRKEQDLSGEMHRR
ncbi:hypothetical protein V7S43_006648 [Phytophthora oleae]|uniref:Uncharacterized protein n=1 Tax=Phytophthora oleae TaxID=2107226 RepID=A0ABD3FQG7_9STRA